MVSLGVIIRQITGLNIFKAVAFSLIAFSVIWIVDYYSRIIAITSCALTVYYIIPYLFPSFNRKFVVKIVSKICILISHFYYLCHHIYLLLNSFRKSNSQFNEVQHSDDLYCGGPQADLEKEINTLISKISQYYIRSWYCRISDKDDFNIYLNSTIKDALVSLCKKVSNVEKKKFSSAALQIYFHFFTHFLEMKRSRNSDWKNFKMKHWAVQDTSTEWCYLQSLFSVLIDAFSPTECERSVESKFTPLLHALIVEILTENIIHRLVGILTDPLHLNSFLLNALLSDGENQIKLSSANDDRRHMKSELSGYSCNSNCDPVIVLSEEETSLQCSRQIELQSEKFLSVPKDNHNSPHDITSKFADKKHFNNSENEFKYFAPHTSKSASNGDLSENDSKLLNECNEVLPMDIKMKRSKSADYIRQIQYLKALNNKEYDITHRKDNDSMCITIKADSSASIELAEEAINNEINVSRLFTDVQITDTIQETESGLFPFTLYCIQYSALFHDTEKCDNAPQLVKRDINIKRRFREFFSLHSSFVNHPILKHNLKGIKGPSKGIPTLPFTNLEKKNVAERRAFLDNYLKEICNIAPLSQSIELQEFLGYGSHDGDARITFAKKNVERIDKLIYRGVKGAIDTFKTALPNSPQEGENPYSIHYDTIQQLKFQEHLLDYSNREPVIIQHIRNYFREPPNNMEHSIEDSESLDDSNNGSPLLINKHFQKFYKCCNCTLVSGEITNFLENPVGTSIFELYSMAADLNKLKMDGIISIIKLFCAPGIEKYVTEKITRFSEEDLASALHSLHMHLWPEESKMLELSSLDSDVNKIMECFEELLSKNSFISNVSFMRRCSLDAIYLFILSIQNQNANKCLLFHLFDAILENVCSSDE